MLASKEARSYYSTMYNDEIMILYMIMACYFCMKNSPLVATFWLSMGLGVKAGVILLIPGFLGSIQYNHGTVTLIKSLIFIIGF
jgi:Gpi18-like mannosyltransferase